MVYIKAKGQLGNLMLEYAAALCCGGGGGQVVLIPNSECRSIKIMQENRELFGDIKVEMPPQDAAYHKETRVPFEKIKIGLTDTIIDGVFFSEKYFDRNIILDRYSPSKRVKDCFLKKYGEWLDRPNVTSIHVRRGDYVAQQYDFPFAGKNYYRAALKEIPKCNDFMVFSDDMRWCKQYFPKAFPNKRFFFVEGNTPLQDIWLMSLCNNNIISNGSFAWWGAWLNKNLDKRVLAPSLWFGFAVNKKRVNPCDIYFEKTEIIQNKYDGCDLIRAYVDFFWRRCKNLIRPAVMVLRKAKHNAIFCI